MKGSNSMKYSCDTRSSKLDESGVPVTAQRLIFASSTAISGPPVLHLCGNQPVRRVHRQFFTQSFLGDDAADLARSSGE